MNYTHLGIELEQPRRGDEISEIQYGVLRWQLEQWRDVYGIPLDREHVKEHWEIDPFKSDVGSPFRLDDVLG